MKTPPKYIKNKELQEKLRIITGKQIQLQKKKKDNNSLNLKYLLWSLKM